MILLRVTLLAICFFLVVEPVLAGQRAPRRSASPQQQTRLFEQLATKANQAREAGQLDDAAELYRQALVQNPKWGEGWWYLATLLYDRERYADAARAFQAAARLQPKIGAPWLMLGLCEFQLKLYDEALQHLRQGRQAGLGDNKELNRVARYHEALLMLRRGDFEAAQASFAGQAAEGANNESLIVALGLSVLRMPLLPKDLPPDHRDYQLVRRLGWAEHQFAQKNLGDAQREYERIAAEYPQVPGVQYAYGRYLVASQNEEAALAAFEREIEVSPRHALARMQIAYIKLQANDPAAGLPYAEKGVELHPQFALGQYVLGRLLFDANQNARAVKVLETARQLAPDEPKIHFTLARAYLRANRKADADRARAEFTRLNKMLEEATANGVSQGSAIQETGGAEATKP